MMALSQSEEVAALKGAYQEQCRVIRDMGDFTYIITLQDFKYGLKLKFQITASYPGSPPNIVISCQQLNFEGMSTLQSEVERKAEEYMGKNMIGDIFRVAQAWCGEHAETTDINVTGQPRMEKRNLVRGKKQQATKKSKSKEVADEVVDEKKSAMKTAEDVIHRILWDGNLSPEHFTVGYLDRFRGIVEKEFSAFSWEDISSVDYDVLSIPKHRIEYFKYKTIKVWDKSQRLDDMFGSTGGKTITETIDEFETRESCSAHLLSRKGPEVGYSGEINQIGTTSASCHPDGPKSDLSVKPNYFVAVHVNNPSLVRKLGAVQKHILDHSPEYTDWCINLKALHITLCRLRLDTQEEIADACRSLRGSQERLAQLASQSIDLMFQGMGVFTDRVLYAKVLAREKLDVFVKAVSTCLEQSGLRICEEHTFVPHLTILKYPRHTVSENQAWRLDPLVYRDFAELPFGHQTVHAIHLCSMLEQKRPDGFYSTPLTLELTPE